MGANEVSDTPENRPLFTTYSTAPANQLFVRTSVKEPTMGAGGVAEEGASGNPSSMDGSKMTTFKCSSKPSSLPLKGT